MARRRGSRTEAARREGKCINSSNKNKPFKTKAATSYAKRLPHIFAVSASHLTILRQIVCSVLKRYSPLSLSLSPHLLQIFFFSISNWSLFHHRFFIVLILFFYVCCTHSQTEIYLFVYVLFLLYFVSHDYLLNGNTDT